MVQDAKTIIISVFENSLTRNIFLISCALCIFALIINLFTGIIVIIVYISTCILLIHILDNPKILEKLSNTKSEKAPPNEDDCGVCGDFVCTRRNTSFENEPWKQIKISKKLDNSIDNFLSRILKNYIEIWFSSLSHDKTFIYSLKQNLRAAICRLLLRLKGLDYPIILSNKLLPTVFDYLKIIRKITKEEKLQMDRVVSHIVLNELPIHPATLNREAELNYLREISKFVIPKLFITPSKLMYSLLKEILACWVLLPALDAISDPNLLNLLVILATTKSNTFTDCNESTQNREKVVILENFLKRSSINTNSKIKKSHKDKHLDDNFLRDQQKLYSFMQYLKREGSGVELLKFYLDIDHLNNELSDSRIISDPTKLSSLQQQSENLLKTYRKSLFKDECRGKDLNDAFEHVKSCLKLKWQNEFCKSIEYFKLVYGDNSIKEKDDFTHSMEQQSHSSHQKFSTKLKEAMNFKPVDGLEAKEIPTVWDGIWESEPSTSSTSHQSPVSSKLRRERGQNLNNFMKTLINSIEQSVEHGEDVVKTSEEENKPFKKPKKPMNNVLYGNLFDLKTTSTLVNHEAEIDTSFTPSKCMIVLMTDVLKVPDIIVRVVAAVCQLFGNFIDSCLCSFIRKTTVKLLDEGKLAKLISILEDKIFGESSTPAPSAQELTHRRELAHERLESLKSGTGETLNYLQSPKLNKHLTYCLFDILVAEIFPEIIEETETDAKDWK